MKPKSEFKLRIITYLCLLLFSIVCLWHLHHQVQSPEASVYSKPDPILYGLYDVVRVIDGDTIVIDIEGEHKTVRLIGVDTPESVHPDAARNTDEGTIASEWTASLLTDTKVYIEYDVDRTDDYGRTLAYVYLDDGITMVQNELLKNGIAKVMTILPNERYAFQFTRLEAEAQKTGAGFWCHKAETTIYLHPT